MKIRDMFVQPIDRNIQGVIKASERDPEIVRHELEEYVVTGEIRRYISTFFQAFNRSIDGPWDKMGVWISGFFGTGKSHLLKILSYLLENIAVNGRHPVDYLEEKLADSFLVAEIRRAAVVPKDVILFNLDAKADSSSSAARDTVVGVFTRAFYEQLGFSSSPMWLGHMEWTLYRMGKYEEFCRTFETVAGAPWIERRALGGVFEEENIVNALVRIGQADESRKWEFLTDFRSSYEMSPEAFARMIQQYLDMKGPDHKVVFLADEMGQFIASSTADMLNLQSVTECLGSQCQGRAWVVATSQQAIEEVASKVVHEDFSKILGRFDTRLSLSSANVDEVIKHRLLCKTDTAAETLKMLYLQKEAICRNLFTFSPNTPGQRLYESDQEFVDTYPFVPYQFDLLQNVFENVRRQGAAGKHLAKGARSMLATIQDAALTVAEAEEGVLIPLSTFYDSMEEFLEPSVREVVEGAKRNPDLKPYDSNVLKALFALKWTADVMPATLDNLTVLMATSIDEDKKALRQRISESLDRLVRQSLVQKDADVFIFLTDDEQDIDREIKRTRYETSQAARLFYDTTFGAIFEAKKVRFKNVYNFDFYQVIDGLDFGSTKAEIGIEIRTPFRFDYSQESVQNLIFDSAHNPDRVYMVLPNDPELVEQADMYLKLDVFLKQKPRINLPSNILRILESREAQREKYREAFLRSAERCITSADFYVSGAHLTVSGRNKRPQEIITEALTRVVQAVYHRIDDIDTHYGDPRELRTLVHPTGKLDGMDPNKLAKDEVLQHLIDADRLHSRVTMKTLVDKYTRKPFGWLLYDLAGVIVCLQQENKIELIYGATKIERDDSRIIDFLTKQSEIDKVIVRHRSPDDEELMRLIRMTAQEVFNRANLKGENQDELVASFKEILQSELQDIKSLTTHYKSPLKYPGEQSLTAWQDMLNRMLDITASPTELKDFLANSLNLVKESHQQAASVRNFFTTPQHDYFRQGVEALNTLREVPADSFTNEAIKAMVELQSIVDADAPYEMIHRIPALRETLIKYYERVCETEKQKTIEVIKNHMATVKQALAATAPNLGTDIIDGFEELKQRAMGLSGLNDIKALRATSEDMLKSALTKIPKLIPPSVDEVPRRRIRFSDVMRRITREDVLASVEDLDEFIQQLSSQLHIEIGQGNVITLE
jgi:hypothetical protein